MSKWHERRCIQPDTDRLSASGRIMKLTLARAAEFMPATGEFDAEAVATGYSIDSRTIQPGELFFAVRGERLDGHDLCRGRTAKGAVAAVVRARPACSASPIKSQLLAVDDPLAALAASGSCGAALWGKPLIGVTGSAGKTTTKEIIAHVLSTRHQRAEVARQSEQSLRNAAAAAETRARARDRRHRDGHVACRRNHGPGEAGPARLRRSDHGRARAPGVLRFDRRHCTRKIRADRVSARRRHRGAECRRRVRLAVRARLSRPRGDLRTAQLSRCDRAQNIESRGPAGSAFDIVADGKSARAILPLLGEHNIYNALAGSRRGPSVRRRAGGGCRVAGARYQPETSAEKCSRSAEPPSSTIATIRIRRLSTAWFVRWRRCRRSAASLSPAKCWS